MNTRKTGSVEDASREISSSRWIIGARARAAASFARVLAEQDPAWRTEVHALAGGWLVLNGAGLYVNRAIGAGLDTALTDDDIDLIVQRSESLGVPPAVEVTPCTHAATMERLTARGFVHGPDGVTALTRSTARSAGETADGLPGDRPADIVVQAVASPAALADWQAVSAIGWGHNTPAARRASDAFTRAAYAIDGEGMVIARDARDDRPLGCASLTVDRVATLGGMSTIPAERRRGVQAALIHHRLAVAHARGCEVAASTARSGDASERNLIRHGFVPRFVIRTWTLRDAGFRDAGFRAAG